MGLQSRQRAQSALIGLAVGDALGMPTQDLPRARAQAILAHAEFVDAPDDQLISRGMPAGTVTDDTEQALLLGHLLVDGGRRVDPTRWAHELLEWEREMVARGSLDLLCPSTRRALDAIRAGADPSTTGRYGTTNGAAMRITPLAIATPIRDLDALIAAVVLVDRPTHNTGVAHAGAAAVAAMVSAGIEGESFDGALPVAVEAAGRAALHGHWTADADVAARITWAIELVQQRAEAHGVDAALDAIVSLVGTSLATTESVPASFAVAALFRLDPWRAALAAARLGGDSDTIAAMAGAMVAATSDVPIPEEAVHRVTSVNHLGLDELVDDLLLMRRQAESEDAP